MAGLSASQFFTLFKRATGYTPMDFFIRARMGEARELLVSTNLTVKEIAAALGYDDQFYFSRRFKLVNGLSPKAFRAMVLGQKPRTDVAPRRFEKAGGGRVPSLAGAGQ